MVFWKPSHINYYYCYYLSKLKQNIPIAEQKNNDQWCLGSLLLLIILIAIPECIEAEQVYYRTEEQQPIVSRMPSHNNYSYCYYMSALRQSNPITEQNNNDQWYLGSLLILTILFAIT